MRATSSRTTTSSSPPRTMSQPCRRPGSSRGRPRSVSTSGSCSPPTPRSRASPAPTSPSASGTSFAPTTVRGGSSTCCSWVTTPRCPCVCATRTRRTTCTTRPTRARRRGPCRPTRTTPICRCPTRRAGTSTATGSTANTRRTLPTSRPRSTSAASRPTTPIASPTRSTRSCAWKTTRQSGSGTPCTPARCCSTRTRTAATFRSGTVRPWSPRSRAT